MFVILSVAAGAAAGVIFGAGVCAFGMWAFLKGQRAAIMVKRGGLPESILTLRSKEADRNAPQKAGSPSLAEQINAMFNTNSK